MNRNGPKCYTNVVQQEYSNNKYYVLAFKYYINIDIANPNDVKYDFINFDLKKIHKTTNKFCQQNYVSDI